MVADFYPAFAELNEYAAWSIWPESRRPWSAARTDAITPIQHTARIIELLPHAETLRVPDCGHLGMIEHHDIFNAVLDRLLERVRRRL